MRLTFTRIEISNFLCFDTDYFDFNLHHGLSLICGKNNDIPNSKNGTGKSSLGAALVYALYGLLPNKVKNENIYNRFSGSKELRVVLWMTVDSDQYKVISATNKYGSPYCHLFKIEEGVETDITKSTIAETREFIEKEIIHCDISLFLRTILLTSDLTYNFFRLSKHDKKEFVEKLFDISVFGDMYNLVHRDILDLDKSMSSILNRLLVLNKNKEDYAKLISDYEEERTRLITEYNATLDTVRNDLNTLKSKHLIKNEQEVSRYETEYNDALAMQTKLNSAIVKLNSIITQLESEIKAVKNDTKTKQSLIDKHSNILTRLCDDCQTVFKKYYSLDKYLDDIKTNESKIVDSNNKISTTKGKIAKANEKLLEISTTMTLSSEKIKELTAEYNKTNQEIVLLTSRMQSITNNISEALQEKNPFQSLLESNSKEIDDNSAKLANLEELYKYLEFALNIVSQETIRKFIIKDLISVLNNRIKYYLTKMGAKFKVEFDENMDYEFITDGGTCEYYNFSAGERMRINLSTSFAFRDFLGMRSNFTSNVLFLDEIIDSNLDSIAVENTIDILKEFIKNYHLNVYVISHRKEISNDLFDNIILIVKTNNMSKITYL